MRDRVGLFLTGSSVFIAVLAISATPAVVPQNAPPAPAGQAREGGGGRGGPNAPPKNLKVLPKEWTTRQVGTLMQTFTFTSHSRESGSVMDEAAVMLGKCRGRGPQ